MLALVKKSAVVLALAGAIAGGTALATPTRADAAVGSCGGGRCTVYFSKSETRALANGYVPAPPAAAPWQLKVAYYSLAYGHRWFAGQYANRGWCSAFRLSIYPWEGQGYRGYACNWN